MYAERSSSQGMLLKILSFLFWKEVRLRTYVLCSSYGISGCHGNRRGLCKACRCFTVAVPQAWKPDEADGLPTPCPHWGLHLLCDFMYPLAPIILML